jgi:hypothetical protein
VLEIKVLFRVVLGIVACTTLWSGAMDIDSGFSLLLLPVFGTDSALISCTVINVYPCVIPDVESKKWIAVRTGLNMACSFFVICG